MVWSQPERRVLRGDSGDGPRDSQLVGSRESGWMKKHEQARITELQLPGSHADIGGGRANAYSNVALQLAQQYMVQRGVKTQPPGAPIDLTDPSLRLHDSGAAKLRDRRGIFESGTASAISLQHAASISTFAGLK